MVKFLDNFGIKATKGDTIIYPFVVVDNDKQIYQVQADDVINFGLKKNYDDAEQRRAYMKKWCENGQKDRRLAHNFRSVYEQFLKHIDGREKEIVTRSRILAERLHNASRPSVCRMLLKPVK